MADTPKTTYMRFIKQFLRGEISGEELQTRYIKRYLSESRPLSEELFHRLETIFGILEDSFVPDEALRNELKKHEPQPGWYIDEVQLRELLDAQARLLNKVKR